jgi:regulator of sigma E protease
MGFLSFLSSTFYFVILLGLCVLVHEWGHFIVAKLCGIRVDKFSIGFGKALYKWKRGDTEFIIAPIPLGGYVKMAGDDPEEANPENEWEFFSAPHWKRCLVVIAGPAMNIVAALVIFFVMVLFYGQSYTRPVVGYMHESGVAAQAGLQSQDLILQVNGTDIKTHADLQAMLAADTDSEVDMLVERNGETHQFTLNYENRFPKGPFVVSSLSAPELFNLPPDGQTPAMKAGLKEGDTLLAVDGKEIDNVPDMLEALRTQVDLEKKEQASWLGLGKKEVEAHAPRPFALKWKTAEGEILEREIAPILLKDGTEYLSQLGVARPLLNDNNCGLTHINNIEPELGFSAQLYRLGFSLLSEARVGKTFQFSPARELGLLPGDLILSIDGEKITDSLSLQQTVGDKVDSDADGKLVPREIEVKWLSDNQVKTGKTVVKLEKVPVSKASKEYRKIGTLGISFYQPTLQFGVLESGRLSFVKMGSSLNMMINLFSELFSGETSARHLAGPVGIAQIAGQLGRQGMRKFMWLMAVLNVNLAVINLFPIPILDGGHLLLFGIEKLKLIFTHRGLTINQMKFAQSIGLVFLLSLMVFVFYNDFARLGLFDVFK